MGHMRITGPYQRIGWAASGMPGRFRTSFAECQGEPSVPQNPISLSPWTDSNRRPVPYRGNALNR